MDGAVEQTPEGKYLIFWRAKCALSGREEKRVSATPFWPGSFEVMRDWVNRFFRHLELIEYRPWNAAEDGGRIRYPVPLQHVRFNVLRPDLERPDARRFSLLVRNPLAAAGERGAQNSLLPRGRAGRAGSSAGGAGGAGRGSIESFLHSPTLLKGS